MAVVGTARQRIRVIVADDHPVFRDGVTHAIKYRPELELVAEAGDGRTAVTLAEERRPDVALFDVRMSGLSGLEALAALRARGITAEVIFLAAAADGGLVHEALSAGAMGFLSKEATAKEICEAIVRAARGEVHVDPRVEPALFGEIRTQARHAVSPITEREREVLRLIAEGQSTAEIGSTLHLSPETVKSHLKNAFAKLEVPNRTAAVATAMRRGLLS